MVPLKIRTVEPLLILIALPLNLRLPVSALKVSVPRLALKTPVALHKSPVKDTLLVVPTPEPFCEMVPKPEIALATVIASDRLKLSDAPLATLTAPVPKVPVVPELPICKTPDEMVVDPVYVFVPVSKVVPAPVCCS